MQLAFSVPNQLQLKAMSMDWEKQVTGPDQIRLVQWAEKLGYGMVSVPEHHVMPREHLELSGPFQMNAYVGMAAYAGATERIRVNSCIAILPLQHPITTAKQLATLDWLSGGRVTVTWAVGWVPGEFELMGVDFAQRGALTEEYSKAIIELWTSEDPQFEGRHVAFKDIVFEPRCVQKPHPPIWFGGDADAVLRRIGRYASGWWPFLTPPEQIPEKIDYIKSQPDYNGRLEDIYYGIVTSRVGDGHVVIDDPRGRPGQTKQELIDRLGWLSDLGVTWSNVPIPDLRSIQEYYDYSQWVAEDVMPAVA